MQEAWRLTASQAARAIAAGELTSEALVRACLARIEVREPQVGAWAWLDPALAIDEARQRDRQAREREHAHLGPLHGLPVGVKDVFDTHDMPTQQNSELRTRHQPARDAAAVALLRTAGAVILGKTETQEFGAGGRLARTRNPHDAARTPGGSSSGSAAAVSDAMVPLALGTQTGGSLIRPASYCGAYAMKPTWNAVSREGAMGSSISQDTVGWYGRSVEDLALMAGALGALREPAPQPDASLSVALCRTPMWQHADEFSRAALEAAADHIGRAGGRLDNLELPSHFERLNELSRVIMAGEGRTAFLPDYRSARELLHEDFRSYVENSSGITSTQLCEALDFSAACRAEFDRIAAPYDAVVVPSAPGEAPLLPGKGDSVFQRMWTLLHAPCINLPLHRGPHGLPIGVTLVSGRHADARLLAAAARILS